MHTGNSRSRRTALLAEIGAIVLAAGLAGCAGEPEPAARDRAQAAPADQATESPCSGGECEPTESARPPGGKVRHVIAISVDGFNPDGIDELGRSRTPTFHRLMEEGAYTLNARSAEELTKTLPNHTSQLTGRRIELPEGHGVTINDDTGTTVHEEAGSYVPGVFDVVHDAGGSTAMYVGKDKFDVLERSWDETNGAPDETGPDDGRDKIDVYLRDEDDSGNLTEQLIEQLATDPPTFAFLHLRDPDSAGHDHDWMSEEYLDALSDADARVGEVLDAVAADPELVKNTVVIVTADHGGTGETHVNAVKDENYTVPFFAWGVGVDAGADLYELNADDRRDPGDERPDYDEEPQPIRNGSVANLVTDLLGLDPVPGSEINAEQDLDLSRR